MEYLLEKSSVNNSTIQGEIEGKGGGEEPSRGGGLV